MSANRIFIIGYMGTDRIGRARELADELNSMLKKEHTKHTNQRIIENSNSVQKFDEESKRDCLYSVLDMDREIERLDGRTILRLCMTMGEHDYRNKEYELLSKLADDSFDIGIAKDEQYHEKLIIACGDGVLLDEMCLEILKKQEVLLLDDDIDKLWENAKSDKSLPYAFLHSGTEEDRRARFIENYERRQVLYNQFRKNAI